eukprot:CAMPEP_0176372506 /NCGR_PEP_ID=MMETSP0126-20121128/25431_1 /TAXON_ID=141414 ORGANISM="Strombidinopsis acuminatum, Strain SPMC142" /NCGR_SAMPLE_ID=MMETSP0126 /ASSEMBLY_ACC=CAM_ASM_000229 /LENGTH=143 /DNA_ID=CAMNT_0017732361 /DNA_START=794 /DNA_END=1228 /DNA_ORIENTATION=-
MSGNSKANYAPMSMSSMGSTNTAASASASGSIKDSVVSSVSSIAGRFGANLGLTKEAPKGMLGATEIQPTMMGGMANYAPPISMQSMSSEQSQSMQSSNPAAYSPYQANNQTSAPSSVPQYNQPSSTAATTNGGQMPSWHPSN